MTRYGFVIDQRSCIGCHACTLACKSENQVPVGSFRTWVKYVEKGEFPNTRRFFTVERCQHCEDAPCVEICPTRALFKRADGIVDFSSDRCIGCKSCMQACPYDALYIDPRSHTAAKCHYCAHRTDRGLLPACVIVCPTRSIIAGDLEDPTSEISRMVSREPIQVRRPDQGTRPQVFYVGADESAITPGLATQPSQYMWSQLGPRGVDLEPKGSLQDKSMNSGAVTVYDVPHPKPWGWKVGAYLWTKSIAAGALAVAPALLLTGSPVPAVLAPALALVFTLITAGLLVWDLKRPDRFWRVLLTPNPRSWLVLGAYILLAYGAGAVLALGAGLARQETLVLWLAWPLAALGVAVAVYSAFLFGQAEGRDFWQSPLLLWQLLAAAGIAGSASLLLVRGVAPTDWRMVTPLLVVLVVSVLGAAAVTLAEVVGQHTNKDVAAAARVLRSGALASRFWGGWVGLGVIAPLLLVGVALLVGISPTAPGTGLLSLASACALVGLWIYEDIWVRAGQSVPMS